MIDLEPIKPDLSFLDVKPDLFRDFEPHYSRLDFDKPVFDVLPQHLNDSDPEQVRLVKLAAKDIAKQLLQETGPPEYWSLPEFEGMRPLEIELAILKDQGRDNWYKESKYGKLCYLHGLMAMKLMFPTTDITPSLADVTFISMSMFGHRRKFLHLVGSLSSGKSSSTARLMLLYAAIDVEHFFGTVATPQLAGGQVTLMGDIVSLYQECREENPWLWPEGSKDASSDKKISFTKKGRTGHGAFLAQRSLKTRGVMRGAKGEGNDRSVGVGIVSADEVNLFEQFHKFKDDLVNASSNRYFQMHTTQNPMDESDEGGMLCLPKEWGDWGVNTFDDVRRDDLLFWPTVDNGIAYRMDGERSVNLKAGKTIYPYLFNIVDYYEIIKNKGEGSDEYWSQVRAMFSGLDTNRHLLSRSTINMSDHDSEWWTIKKVHGMSLGVDPAKTGRGDEAVAIGLAWGECYITMPDGSQKQENLVWPLFKEDSIRSKQDADWDDENLNLYQRYLDLGGKPDVIDRSKPVPYTMQVAIRVGELAEEHEISRKNIFVDPSMDEDIIQAFNMVLGFEPVMVPVSERKVRNYPLRSRKQNTEDRCTSIAQECLFLGSEVFAAKKIRTKNWLTQAMMQTANRRIIVEKPKQPVEDKMTYKARVGYSPDYCDAFCYAVWGAHERGFRIDEAFVSQKSEEEESLYSKLKRRMVRKKRRPLR